MENYEFDGLWTKDYCFEAFKGLQSRRGAYTSMSSNELSDGTVSLTFNDDTSESPDPTEDQINAINFLLEKPELIRDALRNGLHSIYDELKIQYGYQENDEDCIRMFPSVSTLSDYDTVFGVGNVFIQLASKDGYAYVGIECGCSWDGEHGLGYLLHKDRLVSIGSANEAFNWEAYKDNGTFEEVIQEQKIRRNPKKYFAHSKYGKLKPSQESANEAYASELVIGGFNEKFIEEVGNGEIDVNGKYETIDQTYLELAIAAKNYELSKYLLTKGAVQRWAFHQAHRDIESVDLLLDYDGDINSRDRFGKTLIYGAVQELVRLFNSKNQSAKYGWENEAELSLNIHQLKQFIRQLIERRADVLTTNFIDASKRLPEIQQQEIRALFLKDSKLKAEQENSPPERMKSSNVKASSKKWWQFWRK